MNGFLRSLAARGAGLGHSARPRATSAAAEIGVPPSDLAAREPPGEEAAVVTLSAERPGVGAPPALGQPGTPVSAAPATGGQTVGGEAGHSVAVSPTRPEPAAPAGPAPLGQQVEIDGAAPAAAPAAPAASPAVIPRASAITVEPLSSPAAAPPGSTEPVSAEWTVGVGVALPPEAPRAAVRANEPAALARGAAPPAPAVAFTALSSPSPAPAAAPPTRSPARATPVPEPSIEVRIGRLEVRAPRAPDPPPSAPPVPERGFDDLALARRGLERRWY